MSVAPILQPFTPISSQLEVLERTLGAPERRQNPEQLARYLEARDTLDEAPYGSDDLWGGAGKGALVGALAGAAKVIPMTGAGVIPSGSAPLWTLGGLTAAGGLAGITAAWLKGQGQKSRLRKARQTIAHTPEDLRGKLQDPQVAEAANTYKDSLRYPVYGAEAGLTLGSVAGATAGALLGDRGGPAGQPIFGLRTGLSEAQNRSSLYGSIIGAGLAGSVGLLAGILMRRSRRARLVAASRSA